MRRRHRVVLEPQRAFDARLELCDLYDLDDVPPGVGVVLRFRRCADFAAGAPWDVARRLDGHVVDMVFERTAKRIEGDWRSLFATARTSLLSDDLRRITGSG